MPSPSRPPRSPPVGGQGHLYLETGNQRQGAWVLVGIRPCPAPRAHLQGLGHEAATMPNRPGGLLYYLRPDGQVRAARSDPQGEIQ
jgi:hypothetical protein